MPLPTLGTIPLPEAGLLRVVLTTYPTFALYNLPLAKRMVKCQEGSTPHDQAMNPWLRRLSASPLRPVEMETRALPRCFSGRMVLEVVTVGTVGCEAKPFSG